MPAQCTARGTVAVPPAAAAAAPEAAHLAIVGRAVIVAVLARRFAAVGGPGRVNCSPHTAAGAAAGGFKLTKHAEWSFRDIQVRLARVT